MSTSKSISTVYECTKPLIGQKAWEVKLGIGSFITFEFGKAISTSGGYTHGEWHLWIRHCAWRLETRRKVLASSEDQRDTLKIAVKKMENLGIVSVEIMPPALETIFEFEEKLFLRLFPIYTKKYDHWILFMPDSNVLAVGPGNQVSIRPASEPEGK